MILCRKYCIDYDRCDCGTEEKPKKTIGDYITRFIIGVVIVACVVGMLSCNTHKGKEFNQGNYIKTADSLIGQQHILLKMALSMQDSLEVLKSNGRLVKALEYGDSCLSYLNKIQSTLDSAYKQNNKQWDSAFLYYVQHY